MANTVKKIETDVEDFGKEIEAFFKKLLAKVEGNEEYTENVQDMREIAHEIAGTQPPETAPAPEPAAANPTTASSASSSSTASSETSEAGPTDDAAA